MPTSSRTETSSTNLMNNVLKGQQLQISGVDKIAKGNSTYTSGAVILNAACLLAYTNPATTALAAVGYSALFALGTVCAINGTFKEADGRSEVRLGKEITEKAMNFPHLSEVSNIVIFRPATPVASVENEHQQSFSKTAP